ncbi:MAG: formyltetrahydrofolate deformylase [Gammaproteobacteria bacterium]|nr:formyltetrahydrofolate deformylase [Gammaproteobacteria bacterium]MDH5652396.1 formyltetrahydrofolate deformylase [Gammaproteobacteria bacterium]
MSRTFTLLAGCRDRVGIVAHVSGFIAGHKGWITEASYHTDPVSHWFFMRHVIMADSLPMDIDTFRAQFGEYAKSMDIDWQISDSAAPKRVVIFVSKEEHCLAELLYRWRSKDMQFDIAGVISNHNDMRSYVEFHGLPYHYIPVDKQNKITAFSEIENVLAACQADTIVLARYMQILPPALCTKYHGRIINIHHSFLPSFAGAKPYHQAYERGVKLIGATSHYVTEELDAGPIIEQDVIRVSHDTDIPSMVRLGKDVEKLVLARAVRYHLEDRVLVHGNKTVVFA